MRNKNYLKYTLFCILIILSILPIASALEECQEIVTASTNCEVVTTVISCATYDLYNPSHVLDTDEGSMTQIGTTGVYYFTFNKVTAGDWTILLCSNHSSIITIGTTDQVNMNSINTTLYNKIDSTNSSLYTHLTNVNSSVISSIGLLSANLTSINSTLYAHIDLVNNNTISINGTLYTKIGDINTSITNSITTVNTNLLSVNNTLYAEVDTVEENLTWIVARTANQTFWFDALNDSIGSTSSNSTFLAKSVWDYNLTAAGYSTNNTGIAGSIQRYIALTVYWIEKLLP